MEHHERLSSGRREGLLVWEVRVPSDKQLLYARDLESPEVARAQYFVDKRRLRGRVKQHLAIGGPKEKLVGR
jgi:hypothetical protein